MTRLSAVLATTVLALLALLAGSARAETTLYGCSFAGNQLYTINPVTAASSVVGPINPAIRPFGIDFRGNKLYAYDENTHLITQLDPATGAILATINIGTMCFGEGDIAFRSDGIGFLSPVGPPSQLIRFDLSVPNSTVIGPLAVHIDGMAFSASGVLYGLQERGTALYTIDPTTAALTLVGNTGIAMFPNNGGAGLAFDSAGNLYGAVCNGAGSPSFLYKIDQTTGAATLIGNLGFNGVTGIRFAPLPPPPPPPPTPSGSEGSFSGCQDPPLFGQEGSFGSGGHLAAQMNSSSQQPPASRLPTMIGPFQDMPGAGLAYVSPGFASAPPARTRMRIFNVSFRQASGGRAALAYSGPASPAGESALGWAILLSGLGLVFAATLVTKLWPLSGPPAV